MIVANLDLIYKMAKSHAEDIANIRSLSDAQYRSIQCFYSYDPDKTDMNFRFYLAMELKRFLQEESKPRYQHPSFISCSLIKQTLSTTSCAKREKVCDQG